eukprot:5373448-Pleurochrysis_carterae.AAC.1
MSKLHRQPWTPTWIDCTRQLECPSKNWTSSCGRPGALYTARSAHDHVVESRTGAQTHRAAGDRSTSSVTATRSRRRR